MMEFVLDIITKFSLELILENMRFSHFIS